MAAPRLVLLLATAWKRRLASLSQGTSRVQLFPRDLSRLCSRRSQHRRDCPRRKWRVTASSRWPCQRRASRTQTRERVLGRARPKHREPTYRSGATRPTVLIGVPIYAIMAFAWVVRGGWSLLPCDMRLAVLCTGHRAGLSTGCRWAGRGSNDNISWYIKGQEGVVPARAVTPASPV